MTKMSGPCRRENSRDSFAVPKLRNLTEQTN